MSVFKSLVEEHKLLREMGRRLIAALEDSDERRARRESRNILLVLLRALEGHELFENGVFLRALADLSEHEMSAADSLRKQHAAIEKLRWETDQLLREDPDCGSATMRPLAERLVRMLEKHFDSEEKELWPQLNAVRSRAARQRAKREAGERLAELKKELASYWSAVDAYLGTES